VWLEHDLNSGKFFRSSKRLLGRPRSILVWRENLDSKACNRRTKILRNQQRDREVNRMLKKAGWRVLRIWEHELTKKNEANTVRRIRRALATTERIPEERKRTANGR
jgi:G:T-mismatch repair DNA endonuclease (very short patch repair protein)